MQDMPIAIIYAIAIAGGYFFGSIPFGLVITRMAGLGDIRSIGSGNIGATNVLRTGRKDLALATLLLDAGKAGIAAAIFSFIFSFHAGLLAGAAAFVGHCYPVWLKFKGGKGVATFIGMLFGIMWQVGIAFAICWLSIAVAFRYSSLAALVTAALLPALTYWLIGDIFAVCVTAALSILLFYRHRENIKRLMNGTEEKIGKKKANDVA